MTTDRSPESLSHRLWLLTLELDHAARAGDDEAVRALISTRGEVLGSLGACRLSPEVRDTLRRVAAREPEVIRALEEAKAAARALLADGSRERRQVRAYGPTRRSGSMGEV